MDDDCLFCRIAARECASHVLHEDDRLVAFLDIFPIRPGHTLIVPKRHFAYFDDMPADLAASTVLLGQKLATAMKRIYGVGRVAFLFTGDDVPHVHAHLVPMHEKTDITSRRYIAEQQLTFRAAPRMPDRDLAEIAARLAQELAAFG